MYINIRGVREKINFGFAKSAINMSCPYMRKSHSAVNLFKKCYEYNAPAN